MIRNADVEVRHIVDTRKHSVAEITVNGQYQHRFSPKSRISKHLDIMKPTDLADRLTGGSFFFIDDKLIDLRDGQYNGFIHEDASISKFIDVLGYQDRTALSNLHQRKRDASEDVVSDIVLRKVWSNNEISVPGYSGGGDFNSQLSFVWNPFVKTINSAFDLVRLICENGAVGLTSFLNNRVPLMNRWEEHLDIASRQIQNKVCDVVTGRMQLMSLERASVGDCLLLEQHAFDRLYSANTGATDDREQLMKLMHAVAPKAHLAGVYQDNVFGDKNLASQLPSHLTAFDAYNIATEMRTHTSASAKSSDNALDKFANAVLFDRQDNYHASASRLTAPKESVFSSPERAFWGLMH